MSNNSNIKIIKLLSIVIILLILILVLSTMNIKEKKDKIIILKNENVVLIQEKTQLENKNKELLQYDLNNPYDSIILGITNLAFAREYWKQRGITNQEELFYYITTSYNRGISGLIDYIKVNKTPVSRYSIKILRSKSDIEQNNNN